MKHPLSKALLASCLLAGFALQSCDQSVRLVNENLSVSFDERGVTSMNDLKTDFNLVLNPEGFLMEVDGLVLSSAELELPDIRKGKDQIKYSYQADPYLIEVVYELQSGWSFLSMQLFVHLPDGTQAKINNCQPWQFSFENAVEEQVAITGGRYGQILRFSEAPQSVFFLIQNPYTSYDFEDQRMMATYPAEMNWDATQGAFSTDRACLGLVQLSGLGLRHDILPEWSYEPDPNAFVQEGIQLDYAEIAAITNCARSFLLVDPQEAVKVHIGWCENDYQIDMADPAGRIEYKRIIDQAAAVGCEHVLYTPNHSAYGPLSGNRDAWGWENLLWLGLGQKVRRGEWVPGKDPLPDDIQEMIDYAQSNGVKLMAYVYPSLPFMQDSSWTAWRTSVGNKPEHYLTVDTGLKSYQDWFVDLCIAFYEQTGISGYSFDHWWIAYEDPNGLVSSKYQQWYGTRRILEELRRRAPEIIIDGRQQYHHFGTFTWLAGTYPHPMMSDEQPGSFNPFPDLSTDRISANRQRYVAHRLMVRDFTPIEILPGFITHQTQRSDANRVMRRDSYRTRDWDYEGWKYNLISTIATAPFNLVVNYLPARDEQEFAQFNSEDKAFFKKWLSFADEQAHILRNLRPIMGQPMVGRCDGTAAFVGDEGFVFVFNPNYGELKARFCLSEEVGLERAGKTGKTGRTGRTGKTGKYLIREVYPGDEVVLHPQRAYFSYGDLVELEMAGTSARVLKIEPFEDSEEVDEMDGMKQLEKGTLTKTGEPKVVITKLSSEEVSSNRYEILISSAVTRYLSARKLAWPIEYTADDLVAPWLDPSRLLLFINIAEPYREIEEEFIQDGKLLSRMKRVPMPPEDILLKIDEKNIEVIPAFNGVYSYVIRTFLGFYVDISDLALDQPHEIELVLPNDLKEAQFQGIFTHNVRSTQK